MDTDKKSLIFVVPNFQLSTPRSIRFKGLIRNLSSAYNISIIALDYMMPVNDFENVNIHYIDMSTLSKILHKKYLYPNMNWFISKVCSVINLIVRKVAVPDVYKLEEQSFLKELDRLCKNKDIDAVICSVYPFSFFELVSKFKENHNVKWIYDIGDPVINNSALHLNRKRIQNLSQIEASALECSDAVVITNKETKKNYINNYLNLDEKKFHVIGQGTDLVENLLFNNESELNSKLNTKLNFTMLYAGTFYKGLREPVQLFKAMLELDKHSLSILGTTETYGIVSDNISFRSRVEHNEVLSLYQQVDMLIYLDNAYGIQTSGKIFELVAQRKPILFISDNYESEARELFTDCPFLFFCSNDYKLIVEKIKYIESVIDNLCFDYDVSKYSWENRAKNYDEFLLFKKM